jgi:hypothetical protein
MGSGSACMERTGTSRSCPSGPCRESAPRRHLSLSRFLLETSAHRPLLLPRGSSRGGLAAGRVLSTERCLHRRRLPWVRSSISALRRCSRERHWRMCSGAIHASGSRPAANSSRSHSVLAVGLGATLAASQRACLYGLGEMRDRAGALDGAGDEQPNPCRPPSRHAPHDPQTGPATPRQPTASPRSARGRPRRSASPSGQR